jgi:hypothetical protein
VRRYGKIAVILASLALVGCRFEADYGDTNFECTLVPECPDGQVCVNGRCQDDPGSPDDGDDDDGGDTIVGEPDAAPPPPDAEPDCPKVSGFQDDFSDDKLWDLQSDSKDCDVSFIDDEMTLSYELGQTISKCGMYSLGTYVLDGRTWIEVTRPGEGEPAATFGIWVGDESFLFRRVAMDVDLIHRDASGAEAVVKKIPADDEAQRFWSLQPDKDGNILWEISADAKTWEFHHKVAPAVSLFSACIHYEISIFGAEDKLGPPEVVSFDNLNIVPKP